MPKRIRGGGSASDAGQPVPLGVAGSWRLALPATSSPAAESIRPTGAHGHRPIPANWGSQKWRAADSFLDGNGLLVTRLHDVHGRLTGGAIYSKWKLSKGYYEARIKHEGGWFAWWIESPEMGNGGANEDPAIYGTEMDICEAAAWSGNVLDKQHASTGTATPSITRRSRRAPGSRTTSGTCTASSGATLLTTSMSTAAHLPLHHRDQPNTRPGHDHQQRLVPREPNSGIAYVDYVRYWTAQ